MYSRQIQNIKHRLGRRLAILAHHYQSDDIVEHADLVGDSLQLARVVPELEAEYIVFCGVDFMAQTAAIMANPGQFVFAPAPEAICVMADMVPDFLVQAVLEKISRSSKVIPLAYVNSSVGVKAICGRFGGSVCTSSNAAQMLEWAVGQGARVLFLPDKNLGRNTAMQTGVRPEETLILDIRKGGGNIDPADLADKRLYCWPGVCAVHFRIKSENVSRILKNEPDARIVVHPECDPQVVSLAHESGSTSKIISFTRKVPPGSTIYIGTEDNLVMRLKKENPDKNIFSLGAGFCSNMARTNARLLAECLESLSPENALRVNQRLAAPAGKAVETMFTVGAQQQRDTNGT